MLNMYRHCSWWEELTKIPGHSRPPRICLEGVCLLWGALRCATRQRGWKTTMCNHWHTPQSESAMVSAVPRDTKVWHPGHPSCPTTTYHSPMQWISAVLGWGGASPQFPANLAVWWEVYRNSSEEQWSHLSLSQREMSSWPQCHPNGQK